MIQPGERDLQTMPFGSLADVIEASGQFALRLSDFAEALHEDSAAAIAVINPALASSDTEISSDWPLTWRLSAFSREIAESIMKGHKRIDTNPFSVACLESGKYHLDTLMEAYPNSDSPRLALATDMVKWVDVMRGKGREILVMLYLGEEGSGESVEYSVFDDVDVAQTYFDDRTGADRLSAEDLAYGHEPYRWVGNCVIVHGSTDQVDALIAATQPSVH